MRKLSATLSGNFKSDLYDAKKILLDRKLIANMFVRPPIGCAEDSPFVLSPCPDVHCLFGHIVMKDPFSADPHQLSIKEEEFCPREVLHLKFSEP